MEIRVNRDTISEMIELCEKHKNNTLKQAELEMLLEHEDYKIEFERYNKTGGPRGGFSKEEYVDFFMNFFKLNPIEIKNERLKMRYSDLKYFFDNLDFYKEQIEMLDCINETVIAEALTYTFCGLPESLKLDKLYFIFSVGLGNSGGWLYKDYSQYDIVYFLKKFDMNIVSNTIAHEVHHIGLNMFFNSLELETLGLEEYFYLMFSGEGLAVKYCNNGEGILTKRIYDSEPNIGMGEFSWQYLNNDFDDTYMNFKDHISKIRNGEIKDMNELGKYISEYWMGLHTKEQDKTEIPKLTQSRNYSLGNDIWGLIHDTYGKDVVFNTLANPMKFRELYNNALQKINRSDLMI